MIELNPIDILRKRELQTMPPHFSRMQILLSERNNDSIKKWISKKLKGRYCLTECPAIDSEDKFKTSTFVGFEDQKELTYFMLACPFITRRN